MSQFVLISGASTGIGRATSLRLARIGYTVFAGIRKDEDADSLRQEDRTNRIVPIKLDVTVPEQIEEAKTLVANTIGDSGLSGLINNAGIGVGGPIEYVDLNRFRALLEVNTFGPVALTQAFMPMVRKSRGRVIFVGSIAGKMSNAFQGPYCVSKYGIEAIADALRQELSPEGLHVSLIEPGFIETPMLDKIQPEVELGLSQLPAEGTERYAATIAGMLDGMEQFRKRASSPDRVADAIIHALEAPRPKTRYLVGLDAKAAALMSWLLPDRALDFIKRKAMGS